MYQALAVMALFLGGKLLYLHALTTNMYLMVFHYLSQLMVKNLPALREGNVLALSFWTLGPLRMLKNALKGQRALMEQNSLPSMMRLETALHLPIARYLILKHVCSATLVQQIAQVRNTYLCANSFHGTNCIHLYGIDLTCWVDGACDGASELTSFSENNSENCRTSCQDTSDCHWFTFDGGAEMCYHYNGECLGFLDQEDTYTSQNACYRQLKSKPCFEHFQQKITFLTPQNSSATNEGCVGCGQYL